MRKIIEHWFPVGIEKAHRSSVELGEASFATGTVDPRVGLLCHDWPQLQ